MAKEIGLKELAEKIGGNFWEKGDLKRVYLDEGHNTKKMSTKTYVYQKDNGSFGVSCRVECPSQPYQWCESQQDEVIERVEGKIEKILRCSNLELVNLKVLTENTDGIMVYVKEGDDEPVWFTEDAFYDNFGCYPHSLFADVDAAKKEIIKQKQEYLAANIVPEAPLNVKSESVISKVDETGLVINAEYVVNSRVRHGSFGEGTVIASDENRVTVLFDDATLGEKQLLSKFVKMQIL